MAPMLTALRAALAEPTTRAARLSEATAIAEATAVEQLHVRRPHLMPWARKPVPVPPPAHTGQVILRAAGLLLVDARDRAAPCPEHALRLLGGLLHPEMHLHDALHPDREFHARLPAAGPGSRDDLAALLAALPEADRSRCLRQSQPVPWPYLHTCPTDAVLRHALDDLCAWTRKPEYDEAEVIDGLVAAGDAVRPLLEHALLAGTPSQRHLLTATLERLNTPEALSTWVHLLGDSRADLRAAATRGLVALGEAVALPAMAHALAHRRKATRLAAAHALAAFEPSEAVREAARAALASSKTADEAIEAVLRPLTAEAEPPGKAAWRAMQETEVTRARPLTLYQNPVRATADDPTFLHDAARQMLAEPMDGHLQLWEQTLRIFAHLDAAPWAALDVFTAFDRHRATALEAHLKALSAIFGDALTAPILDTLHRQRHDLAWLLLGWLADRAVPALPLYLDALTDGTPAERDVAVRGLAASGADALPKLLPLLTSRKKAARAAAATALRRLAHPDALPALEAARAAEKDAAVADLLQRAADASRGRTAAPVSPLHTPWDPDTPDAVNALLGHLRELLHTPMTPVVWALTWNALDRLARLNAADLGFDYLRGALKPPPHVLAYAPWTWRDHPALDQLLGAYPLDAEDWVTLDTVLTGRARPWLETRLAEVERRARVRPLPPAELDTFADAVRRAWRLCQTHHLDPATLELRVDGGAARRGLTATPVTTALWLVDGFAVHLERTAAIVDGDGLPAGLRIARVPLPPDHPARDTFNLGARDTHLDLRPLLADA